MHDTALAHGKLFFDTYVGSSEGKSVIVDVGSQDVNGSLRCVAPGGAEYVGVDFQKARGVDLVMTDPYSIPIVSNTADICVTSSCIEHSEFFWLLFLDMLRILKPSGLLYINVPSNGAFHQYPVDCWRFYPDSGLALQNWARKSGTNCAMLESFVGDQGRNGWNDFVAVFVKDETEAGRYPKRMLNTAKAFTNGRVYGEHTIIRPRKVQEDQADLRLFRFFRKMRRRWQSG